MGGREGGRGERGGREIGREGRGGRERKGRNKEKTKKKEIRSYIHNDKASVNDIHVSGQDFSSQPRGRAVVIICYTIIIHIKNVHFLATKSSQVQALCSAEYL